MSSNKSSDLLKKLLVRFSTYDVLLATSIKEFKIFLQ